MPPRKGTINNPTGRPSGSKNRITQDLRALVIAFLNDNWQNVLDDYKELTPKERLMFFERLLAYGLPKMQSVDINATTSLESSLKKLPDDQLDSLIRQLI